MAKKIYGVSPAKIYGTVQEKAYGIDLSIASTPTSLLWTVKTDNAGTSGSTQFTFPTLSSGTYDCVVNWGDGGAESTITTYNNAAWTHTFAGGAGTYDIEITGQCEGAFFNDGGDKLKLLEIKRWGVDFRLESGSYWNAYFFGCSNLVISATDTLNLSGTDSLQSAFRSNTALTAIPNMGDWDITAITTMIYMLYLSTLSTANYDTILVGWESQAVTSSVNCWMGGSKYTGGSAAATARAALISDHSWSITDGGTA